MQKNEKIDKIKSENKMKKRQGGVFYVCRFFFVHFLFFAYTLKLKLSISTPFQSIVKYSGLKFAYSPGDVVAYGFLTRSYLATQKYECVYNKHNAKYVVCYTRQFFRTINDAYIK